MRACYILFLYIFLLSSLSRSVLFCSVLPTQCLFLLLLSSVHSCSTPFSCMIKLSLHTWYLSFLISTLHWNKCRPCFLLPSLLLYLHFLFLFIAFLLSSFLATTIPPSTFSPVLLPHFQLRRNSCSNLFPRIWACSSHKSGAYVHTHVHTYISIYISS